MENQAFCRNPGGAALSHPPAGSVRAHAGFAAAGRSHAFFPLAGAIIGALISAVLIGANMLGLPSLLAAAVALAAGVLVTGALHEDGLADVADGFGGGHTREQRLEIMRDSRIGTYGTIALCLTFIGRAAIYETLSGVEPLIILALLASAAAFSRSLIVDLLWATRPARSDGLSVFAGRPGKRSALFSLLTGGIGAALAVGLALSPEIAVIAIIAAGIVLAGLRALAMRKIGGQTGDVCGAVQVLTELTMLTVYAATIG